MILFDNCDYEKFFTPLCRKNRKIYYECISILINRSKEVPVLYESEAKDCISLYLKNCNHAIDDEDSEEGVEISRKNTLYENAASILNFFRKCCWVSQKELGRNGDNIADITPQCRKLIDAIDKIFIPDANSVFTNDIFSIYEILSASFKEDNVRNTRPYTNILIPVNENIENLRNKLLDLKDSIQTIMRVVIQMMEANDYGRFMLKDELMHRFFSEYFLLKKDGLIPGYIKQIDKMLKTIKDTDIYEKMISEYAEKYGVDYFTAKEYIENMFNNFDNFINHTYEIEMDNIDRKINNYYNLYATRMHIVLSNGTNLQNYVHDILMSLKTLDNDKKEEFFNSVSEHFNLYSYKYIGNKSLMRNKKQERVIKTTGLSLSTLTEEERREKTEHLLSLSQDKYNIKQVSAFFYEKLKDKKQLTVSELNVQTREEVMLLASGITYSMRKDFPFKIELSKEMVETDIAVISDFIIKRRK